MITYSSADIFEVEVKALVNPVNCVGVAGAGLARAFKQRYVENFIMYKEACENGHVIPGRVFITKTTSGRYIINFPTKAHWRDKSNLHWIEAGLADMVKKLNFMRVQSVAIPMLGCGLGGLPWSDVRPLIEKAFIGADIDVVALGRKQ